MQTIIKAKGLVDMNSAIVRSNQYVAVKGKTIAAVGAIADMPAVHPEAKVLDCCDKYILPGLVNSHEHADTVLVSGAIIMEIPMVHKVEDKFYKTVINGNVISLDADKGIIRLNE